MATKLLTPAELLKMALAAKTNPVAPASGVVVKPTTTPIVNPTAAQQVIINQQAVASAKATGGVTPVPVTDTSSTGGKTAADAAIMTSFYGAGSFNSNGQWVTGGSSVLTPAATPAPAYTAPTYTPINVPAAVYTAPDTTPAAYTAPAYTAQTAPTPIPTPVAVTAAYTNPSTGPLVDAANAVFADYQKSATGAANNVLDAQMAQANSIINSGGIWATLQPIADKQMQDSMAALLQISTVAKANVEASRTALNAQDAADYAKVIETLDSAVVASRQQTTEQMNQRGMFFSTVLDSVMGKVNAAYTTQKGQAAQQDKASLAKIASDMAVLSGNIDIETIKGNASAVAQYTAQMLSVVTQDAQTKQTAQALLASLNTQKAGVVDAVATQVFAVGQQMQATAFSQQEQLNTDAANAAITQNNQNQQAYANTTNAANTLFSQQSQLSSQAFNQQIQQNTDAMNAAVTKYSQQVQANLDAANAQATAFNQAGQLSTMAFNQQVQQNADAANASNTAFSQQEQVKLDAANAAITASNQKQQDYANTTNAANTAFDQNRATASDTAAATTASENQFIAAMGQYSNDYLAAAKNLDPSTDDYVFKVSMLTAAHNQKAQATTAAQAQAMLDTAKAQAAADQQTFDNKMKSQTVGISSAAQKATAAYQAGQLIISQQNANTSQQNANTSSYNSTKSSAGTTGTTAKAPPSVWTNAQARSFKAAYETVSNMVVGAIISDTQAQDPNLVGGGVNLVAGTAWTAGQKAAYLSSNKGLYDSAISFINQTTPNLWSPNNPQLPAPFRAMLQSMINEGTPINTNSVKQEISTYAQVNTAASGAQLGGLGADYDYLMGIFNKFNSQ